MPNYYLKLFHPLKFRFSKKATRMDEISHLRFDSMYLKIYALYKSKKFAFFTLLRIVP